jgi:hypothetical protein
MKHCELCEVLPQKGGAAYEVRRGQRTEELISERSGKDE